MNRETLLQRAVGASLFAFPILAVSVEHGATAVYSLLGLLGVVFGWPAWKRLSSQERWFIYSMGALLFVLALSLAKSDDFSRGLSKLERYVRFPLFIPALLLLIRTGSARTGRLFLAGSLAGSVAAFAYAGYQTLIPRELFSVPAELSPRLSEGELTRELRNEFDEQEYPLTKKVAVTSVTGGWMLKDGNQRWAALRGEGGVLKVRGPTHVRATGAYDSIIFGDSCIYLAAVIAAWLITASSGWRQYGIGAVGLALAFYSSLLSGTRGAWICFPVLGLFVLLLYARRLRWRAWVGLLTGLLGLLALGPLLVPDGVANRVADLRERLFQPTHDVSFGERLQMWEASLTIFGESPLLGSGLGDFKIDMQRLIDEGRCDLSVAYDHAHSIYFDGLARTGLLGTVAMLVVVFAIPFWCFVCAWRGGADAYVRFNALGGMLTILTFATFGLTEAWFSRMPLVTTYIVSTMVFLAHSTDRAEEMPDAAVPESAA